MRLVKRHNVMVFLGVALGAAIVVLALLLILSMVESSIVEQLLPQW